MVHLSYLASASPLCGPALRCYQRALCEQLGATLARVKDEPKVAHECLHERAGCAISRASNRPSAEALSMRRMVPPAIAAEGSRLLARLSQTLRNPSVWKFSRRAGEALALSRHALATARSSTEPEEIEALSGIVVGSATLGSDLMRARMVLQGKVACNPNLISWARLCRRSPPGSCSSLAVFVPVDAVLTWRGFYRLFWHAPLARFALFVCLFCGGALVVANH